MKAPESKNFHLNIQIDGIKQDSAEVNYKETTDGIPYYEFDIDGQQIQLRKDDKWKLLWGELDEDTVAQLGEAIDNA
jgi:hypothetical protein